MRTTTLLFNIRICQHNIEPIVLQDRSIGSNGTLDVSQGIGNRQGIDTGFIYMYPTIPWKEKILDSLDPLSRFLTELTTAIVCILRLRRALDDAVNDHKHKVDDDGGDGSVDESEDESAPGK